MKPFQLLIILGLLYSCMPKDDFRHSEKSIIANKCLFKSLEKLQNELGLIPFGFGGRMMYQVERMSLTFQYRQLIDVKDGRKILMKAAEIFLSEINSSEPIRKYLCNYPFEPKNIEIVICLTKPDGREVDSGKLRMIEISEGMLEYTYDLHDKSKSKTIKETYEEALEILKQETEEKEAI